METTNQYRIVYKCADGTLQPRAGVSPTLEQVIDVFDRNKCEQIGWSTHALILEETVSDLDIVLSTRTVYEV
jgi:hypothetical protein